MSDVKLSSFPSNKTAALTMLYLEKQDFSNLTPSQLVDKYDEVYNEITQRMKENKKGKKSSF